MSRISPACCSLARWSRPFTRPVSCHLRQSEPSILRLPSYTTQASPAEPVKLTDAPSKDVSLSQKTTYTPKIEELVQSIGQLTLLEAAELVEALKSRLKITEVAMPVQSASLSGAQSGGSQGEAKQKKEEPQKPKEQTAFTLTLVQIDAAQKAKVIKEVKTIMPNMNLVEAKKFVESLPKQLKENGTKEEIDKLKKALESVGATVKVE